MYSNTDNIENEDEYEAAMKKKREWLLQMSDPKTKALANWDDSISKAYRQAKPETLRTGSHCLPGVRISQIRSWLDGEYQNGALILSGSTGTGKTWAAHAIARGWVSRTFTLPRVYAWWDLIDFNESDHSEKLKRAARSGFLVLDDLGTSKNPLKDYELKFINRIMDNRYNDSLPTIITTNLDEETLKNNIGPRAWSRLGQHTWVTMSGTDQRKS